MPIKNKSKSLNKTNNNKKERSIYPTRSQSQKTNNRNNNNRNNVNGTNNTVSEFNKLIDYLTSFNKLEKQAKLKYKLDNPNEKVNDKKFRLNIPIELLKLISLKAYSLFSQEPNLLKLSGSLYIFGDIHGQFCDLLRFIELIGMPIKSTFLFLGDYVDRGDNSLEVIALLFSLKIKYPKNVFLLRGNHECAEINSIYGFKEECSERYKNGITIWKEINKTLRMLPICALVNKKIFCTHGGISPSIDNLEQINKINRNVNIPDKGILCDLVWSDPEEHKSNWNNNERGISYTFNGKAVDNFISKCNIDLIVRAHQVVDNGYEFFNKQKLVTVFSAPNYCGQIGNDASIMTVNNSEYSFITLKPTPKTIKKKLTHSVKKCKK